MPVIQGFRFELDPNREQRDLLARHVGAARYAYNWGLARCREALARGERIPSAVDLHKQWNVYKREHAPWWTEVSKCAPKRPSGIWSGPSATGKQDARDSLDLSARRTLRTTRPASPDPFG